MRKAIVFAMLSALPVAAQVSTDEAMAKLNAKESAAATQPSELREEAAKLRLENVQLKKELAAAKAEIAELQTKLTAAIAVPAAPSIPAKPIGHYSHHTDFDAFHAKLKTGMTEDDVKDVFNSILGVRNGQIDGWKSYVDAETTHSKTVRYINGVSAEKICVLDFVDGKIVSITWD